MKELNHKLLNEASSPFHAYLLLSNSSKYVLEQALQFASMTSLSQESTLDHPDVRIIESENINTIGIENIRDVLNKENLSPISGKYKTIIFPPYKSLTEEASNALLKTLEEPSETSIFILTSTGNFWSHAKDDANVGIIKTIKSRCRTIFIESERITTYDFSPGDFLHYVDIEDFPYRADEQKVNNLVNILQNLVKAQSVSSKNMYNFQSLLKVIKEIQQDFDNSTATFANKLLTRSLEYVVRHILSTDQIGKLEYRHCEQVQSAIEDIQQGMRDSIVLNNLSVELAKL